jgi:hypothetical protein
MGSKSKVLKVYLVLAFIFSIFNIAIMLFALNTTSTNLEAGLNFSNNSGIYLDSYIAALLFRATLILLTINAFYYIISFFKSAKLPGIITSIMPFYCYISKSRANIRAAPGLKIKCLFS